MSPRRTCTALTIALLALTGAVAQPASAGACASASAVASTTQMTRATLCLLNQERAKHGLKRLRMNRRLSTAARRHAQDMVNRDYFSHDSPTGSDFVDRIRRTGYSARSLGENLACGSGSYATPSATVQSWMNSAGHRANILHRRFRQVGIGVVRGAPTFGSSDSATYALTFGG